MSNTLSSWSCWASNSITKLTDNLHQELTKNENPTKDADLNPADDDMGNSFWSNFGQKRPPPMCMSVSTISEPEDN